MREHQKNFMRRKTSKEILAESFRELAETKPVNKITVLDIVENCGYSSATFYRQFNDKYDLVAWDYITHCRAIMDKIDDGYTWEQAMTGGCRYLYDQRTYIVNLLRNTSGHESFFRYMSLANTEIMTKEIRRKQGRSQINEDLAICARLFCYGAVQVLCDWLLGELKATPEQLSALLIRALPEPLASCLCNK